MSIDLKTSVSNLQVKTKAAKLRALMPLIEAKVSEGVRHADIILALNEQGFAVNEMTYRTYLKRHRQKRTASVSNPASPPLVAKEGMRTTPTPFSELPPRVSGSRPPTFEHDPKGNPDLLK